MQRASGAAGGRGRATRAGAPGTAAARRTARALAVLAIGLLVVAPRGAAAAPLDLTGTWHVLVHYTDDLAHDQEALRWDDRIWVFEPEGDRLRWTEYPIVVFQDRSGRFEQSRGGMLRSVHAWEPNPVQLEQIREGLEINTRGSKSKTLRPSADGWRSGTRNTAASASFITYEETWSIEDPDALPVFTRDDVMGGGMAESFEGRTQYETTEVSPDASVLRGRFERDGTRHGTFRLMRAAPIGIVKGSGKTQEQRTTEMFREQFFAGLAGTEEFKQEVRAEVVKGFRASGLDPDEYAASIDRVTEVTAKEVAEGIREGQSIQAMQQRVRESTADAIAENVLRDQIRARIEEDLRSRGLAPEEHADAVARATDAGTEEAAKGLRAGQSQAAIERRVTRRLEREFEHLEP